MTITTAPRSASIQQNIFHGGSIVSVRSVKICTLMDDGIECCNCGRSFLMLSATEMMFGARLRWTFTITAGHQPGFTPIQASLLVVLNAVNDSRDVRTTVGSTLA